MKATAKKFRFAIAVMATIGMVGTVLAQDVIIGHFGDPAPVQSAVAEGKFEKATGWNIQWRKFASGADVIAAMASGDVQISDLGSSPTAIAVSQGVPIKVILNSFVIGNAESLIVRDGAGISKPSDLKGKRVAVPIGSTSHFALMGALAHWRIDPKDVNIIGMAPEQINAAWTQGAIDAAYTWEPVQSSLLKTGKRMVGSGEVAEWGYPTFNDWVVGTKFATKNAAGVTAFIKVMNEVNAAYMNNPDAWTASSVPVKGIAERTGAAPDQIPTALKGYKFLTAEQQVAWLDDVAAKALKSSAEFLKSVRRIDTVADDYSQFVDSEFAKAAAAN